MTSAIKKTDKKYIVFECFGDSEKNMAGTAVVNALSKKYTDRKIVVVTNIVDIWLHHRGAYRVYDANKVSYFYDDYIKDCDTLIMRQDPYKTTDFIQKKCTLIEAWCKLCGIDTKSEPDIMRHATPFLKLTFREKEVLKRLTKSDKPLVLLHAFEYATNAPAHKQFSRNIPFDLAQKITDYLTKKGYAVIMPKIDSAPEIKNALTFTFGPKMILAMPLVTKYAIVAHSAYIHSQIALKNEGEQTCDMTVIWSGNKHTEHGYQTQKNIYPVNLPQSSKEFIDNFNAEWSHFLLPGAIPQIGAEHYYFDEIISHIK